MILKKRKKKEKKRNENERERQRERERESGFISNTTMHLVPTDRVRNKFACLFIIHPRIYIDRGQSYSLFTSVSFFFLFVIFVKKKRETDKHGVRGSKEQGPGNNIQEKREQVQ